MNWIIRIFHPPNPNLSPLKTLTKTLVRWTKLRGNIEDSGEVWLDEEGEKSEHVAPEVKKEKSKYNEPYFGCPIGS